MNIPTDARGCLFTTLMVRENRSLQLSGGGFKGLLSELSLYSSRGGGGGMLSLPVVPPESAPLRRPGTNASISETAQSDSRDMLKNRFSRSPLSY